MELSNLWNVGRASIKVNGENNSYMTLELVRVGKIAQCIISTDHIGFETKTFLRFNDVIPVGYRPCFQLSFLTGNATENSYVIQLFSDGGIAIAGNGTRLLNLTNKTVTYITG